MRRREFIALIGGLVVAWSRVAYAQQPRKAFRIAYQSSSGGRAGQELVACFREGLGQFGWIEGQNIELEVRSAEGRLERIPTLAAELVRLKFDLIVASGTQSAQAVQQATRDIPVVLVGVSDPVASGIVASLARPGGNVTGVSNFQPALTGKLVELLKTAAPQITRVLVLRDPANAGKTLEFRELQAIGPAAGVTVEGVEVRNAEEIGRAFASFGDTSSVGLIVLADGVTLSNRQQILDGASKARLPAVYQAKGFVDAGGLMSYGLNFCQHFHRAAYYVDKILKGAKPADLPVEQPTKFELVINLGTAKALGLTVPPTLLARADEVIE
jgi:putative ABC transport system substrate-binding protein